MCVGVTAITAADVGVAPMVTGAMQMANTFSVDPAPSGGMPKNPNHPVGLPTVGLGCEVKMFLVPLAAKPPPVAKLPLGQPAVAPPAPLGNVNTLSASTTVVVVVAP